MKSTLAIIFLIGTLSVWVTSCTSESSVTEIAKPSNHPNASAQLPASGSESPNILPHGADVDKWSAMLMGIDLHRQLWETRPSNNYKFGFQWNEGAHAYETANVEVRVIKGEVASVMWAEDAVKEDGSEPEGFVVPDEPENSDYLSIDGLFELIRESVEADPHRVSIGFHSQFGFPTSAIIEFPPNSEMEDVSFFAAQLEPIFGPPE